MPKRRASRTTSRQAPSRAVSHCDSFAPDADWDDWQDDGVASSEGTADTESETETHNDNSVFHVVQAGTSYNLRLEWSIENGTSDATSVPWLTCASVQKERPVCQEPAPKTMQKSKNRHDKPRKKSKDEKKIKNESSTRKRKSSTTDGKHSSGKTKTKNEVEEKRRKKKESNERRSKKKDLNESLASDEDNKKNLVRTEVVADAHSHSSSDNDEEKSNWSDRPIPPLWNNTIKAFPVKAKSKKQFGEPLQCKSRCQKSKSDKQKRSHRAKEDDSSRQSETAERVYYQELQTQRLKDMDSMNLIQKCLKIRRNLDYRRDPRNLRI